MLEAFHSYAYALFLIGEQQAEGSSKQRCRGGSSTRATAPSCHRFEAEAGCCTVAALGSHRADSFGYT